MASLRSISVVLSLAFVGCSASETPNRYQGIRDEGRSLPIILTQNSVIDTTITLSGPAPSDTAEPIGHQDPLPKVTVQPVYPVSLKRQNIQGMVWVKALVTPGGDVAQASIMKSDHEGFNQAALRAVIQWKFDPDYQDSTATARWIAIPMRFRLNP